MEEQLGLIQTYDDTRKLKRAFHSTPQGFAQEKKHDSGKKKRHARQHLAIANQDKRILVWSQAREGTMLRLCLIRQNQLPSGNS